MAYSTDFKIEVLNYAKKYGPAAAADKYNITKQSVIVWNRKYKIYTPRNLRTFTTAQKIHILEHAVKYGICYTALKYRVAQPTLMMWNQEYNIYTGKQCTVRQKRRKFSIEKKCEILTYAKQYGWTTASYKYNLTVPTLYLWNMKLNIVQMQKKPKYTDAEKQEIVQYAQQYSVGKAVFKFGASEASVRNWCAQMVKSKEK